MNKKLKTKKDEFSCNFLNQYFLPFLLLNKRKLPKILNCHMLFQDLLAFGINLKKIMKVLPSRRCWKLKTSPCQFFGKFAQKDKLLQENERKSLVIKKGIHLIDSTAYNHIRFVKNVVKNTSQVSNPFRISTH